MHKGKVDQLLPWHYGSGKPLVNFCSAIRIVLFLINCIIEFKRRLAVALECSVHYFVK